MTDTTPIPDLAPDDGAMFAFEVLGAPFKGVYARSGGALRIEGDLGPLPYSIQARGVRSALRDLVEQSHRHHPVRGSGPESAGLLGAWLEITPARHIQLVAESREPIEDDTALIAALARLGAAIRPHLKQVGALLDRAAA